MTFMRRPFRRRYFYALGHLGAEKVNCSEFLFLLFHLISTNIANWNKCKRIFYKECMSQICANSYTDRRRNNGGRRRPMFSIAMLNVHDRVLYDQVRACTLLVKKSDTISCKNAGKSAT